MFIGRVLPEGQERMGDDSKQKMLTGSYTLPYFSCLARLHLQVLQGEPFFTWPFFTATNNEQQVNKVRFRQPTVIPRVSFARDKPPRVREWWLIKSPFVRSSQM